MAEFIPTPGYENCGKCGGWQVLDKTIRRKNGWPIGPIVMDNCDHCAGAGQIKIPVEQLPPKPIVIRDSELVPMPWGTPAPAPEPAPIKVEGWGAPSSPTDTVAKGWANYDAK